MHSYVYQVSLQPVQSESYAKAGHLPDWFYEQVCSYAENADSAWREQAIQELVQFLGPLCNPHRQPPPVSPSGKPNMKPRKQPFAGKSVLF